MGSKLWNSLVFVTNLYINEHKRIHLSAETNLSLHVGERMVLSGRVQRYSECRCVQKEGKKRGGVERRE